MHKMLKTHKMHQTLKVQVLEIVVLEMQKIAQMHKIQEIVVTALVTLLEIATNF